MPVRDVFVERRRIAPRELRVPHIIRPADRKWCLATLYSGHSNYLAGARTMIDTVLSSGIEAYSVALTDQAH